MHVIVYKIFQIKFRRKLGSKHFEAEIRLKENLYSV